MDGVSDAASLITLLQLASNIIKYVKDVKNVPAQRKRLLSALVQARGLLSTLIDLTNDVYDDNWSYTIQSLSTPNGPLSMFQEILEQIAGKIGVPTSGSSIALALHRLQWPFDQTGFQDVMASLEKLKSYFLLAIANDHLRLSLAIRDGLNEIHSQLSSATIDSRRRATMSLSREQKLIVDSLSLMNLSGEMDGEKAMRMRTSTEWFLRHVNFMQWHDVNTTPNTLVLTGSPGSGKSSICQVTRFFLKAWHQSEIDVCVAYLALNSFQKEELTVSGALSNIVQQMMLERPYLMDHVNTLKFTGGQLSRAESIDVISRSRYDLKQFYLILDGLDEGENMGRELFEDLLTIEPPLKILVATRPNRGIMMTFRNCVTINLNMSMSLSGHLEYVITLLEKDPRMFGYLDHNHDNVANAAKIIADKSNGIHIHTNAIVNSLAQAETRAGFELLLYDPPSCLHDMYKLMLDNVLQQPAEFAAFAKKTLRVMLQASSPVSISHLAKASKKELEIISYKLHLGRDPTEGEIFEACVSSCKGFVSAASDSTDVGMRLQLFHFSVREFFQVNGLPE